MSKTPFLTPEQISELPDGILLAIIRGGDICNWDILFDHENQKDLDDYMYYLFEEKSKRKLI